VKFISNIAAKYIGSSEFHHENPTKLRDINDFSWHMLAHCLNLRDLKLLKISQEWILNL